MRAVNDDSGQSRRAKNKWEKSLGNFPLIGAVSLGQDTKKEVGISPYLLTIFERNYYVFINGG